MMTNTNKTAEIPAFLKIKGGHTYKYPTLQARGDEGDWHVVDSSGGVWWPNRAAEAAINRSSAPADLALYICITTPMRGRWSS